MARKRKRRRRNVRDNHPGLGAFLGSAIGTTGGALIGAGINSVAPPTAGPDDKGAVYVIFSMLGSVIGGAVGGVMGAADDRKERAFTGGGWGGVFGPIGAAVGGYVGGLKPDGDRRNNPSPAMIALGVAGTGAALGLGYAGYRALRSRGKLPAAMGGEILVPSPVGGDGDVDAEDDWGTGMTASTVALIEGVPVRLLQDAQGNQNFAYSWAIRNDREGSGPLWDWLRAHQSERKTVLVLTHTKSAADAFRAASKWLGSMRAFVTGDAPQMEGMEPGFITTPTGNFYLQAGGRDGWGLMWRLATSGDLEGFDRSIGVVDTDDPKNWAYGSWYPPSTWDAGWPYTFEEAAQQLQETRRF